MKRILRKLGFAYIVIGAILANIMWVSYMWPVVWAPAHVTFVQQTIGIIKIQPVALFAAAVRLVLWGPALALWWVAPRDDSFGEWLAPGFYAEPIEKR